MKEKCYMCSSVKIYNPQHDANEIPLCEKHFNQIQSARTHGVIVTATGGNKKGIIKSGRTWGIELESHAPSRLNFYAALALLPKNWGSSGDGTIRHEYGQELKTNPMKNAGGEKLLTEFLTILTQDLGWDVTPTCGTHCHIGVPEYAKADAEMRLRLRNLVILYTVFDPVIRCLLPLARRSSNFCNPLMSKFVGIDNKTDELHEFTKKTKDIDEINHMTVDEKILTYRKKNGGGTFSKYYGINFSSLRNRGTIEIRYHEGTLDPVRLIHWIALHSGMISLCLDGGVGEDDILQFAKIKDVEELFEALLSLTSKYLDPSTVVYMRGRFAAYKHQNPKDGYISQSRYDPAKMPQFELPPTRYELQNRSSYDSFDSYDD